MVKKDDTEEVADEDIEEKMYLLTKSIKRNTRYLGTAMIGVTILALFTLLFTYGNIYDIENYGTITELYDENCPEGPDLSINQTEICYFFNPHEGVDPAQVVAGNYQLALSSNAWTWVWLIIIIAPLTFTYVKIRSDKKKIEWITDEFIRDSYFYSVELGEPEGKNRGEKIFNLLEDVFPEIRDLSKDEEIELKKEKVGKYTLEFKIETKDGKIGVMFFDEKLTFENLKEFIKKIKNGFDAEGDRIICIAKEFDQSFNDEDLEEKMDGFDIAHIDILEEKENGYSIMWLD